MVPVVGKAAKTKLKKTPRILVVDDEPTLIDLVGDVVGGQIPCSVISAKNIAEAKKILASTSIELLVADVHLPDGKGTELLASLKEKQPQANAIVITGQPSMDGAINAMRHGAVDFLPKPFSAASLVERVGKALELQALMARKERRLDKLRDAVKRLNEARRLVSKKVDLLCNDLITAYGELSKQLDVVRTQEGFRKLLGEAKDLEQLLCHAMDWLLRQIGYANVAIWLTGDEGEYQLGAYMKYTTAGEQQFTEAMKHGLLKVVNRDAFVHLSSDEVRDKLSHTELQFMAGQSVLAVTCTYLGENLATVIMFRDAKAPFTDDDAQALKSISPIFATSLAGSVHDEDDNDDDGGGSLLDDDVNGGGGGKGGAPKKTPKDKTTDADWWKRGEAPPF
jgi:FixJ family two-component response regulator